MRIIFTFEKSRYNVSWSADSKYIKMLKDIFGWHPPLRNTSWPGNYNIICTPEQFARFIIERNNCGGDNLIKTLNAQEYKDEQVIELVKCDCDKLQDTYPLNGSWCISSFYKGDYLTRESHEHCMIPRVQNFKTPERKGETIWCCE